MRLGLWKILLCQVHYIIPNRLPCISTKCWWCGNKMRPLLEKWTMHSLKTILLLCVEVYSVRIKQAQVLPQKQYNYIKTDKSEQLKRPFTLLSQDKPSCTELAWLCIHHSCLPWTMLTRTIIYWFGSAQLVTVKWEKRKRVTLCWSSVDHLLVGGACVLSTRTIRLAWYPESLRLPRSHSILSSCRCGAVIGNQSPLKNKTQYYVWMYMRSLSQTSIHGMM